MWTLSARGCMSGTDFLVGFATKGEVGQLPKQDGRGRSVATGFSIARGSILTSELEEKV